MSISYCCENKCFETPKSQVDGLACTRCASYCYCVCNCKIIQDKMEVFTNKILKKAKDLQILTDSMIGVKIFKGYGYVATNCRYLPLDEIEETKNLFYMYHDCLEYIPEISLEPNEHTIAITKTFESKVYVLNFY